MNTIHAYMCTCPRVSCLYKRPYNLSIHCVCAFFRSLNKGTRITAKWLLMPHQVSPFHPTLGQGSYLLDEGTRKPKPGMIFEAVLDLNINLEKSVMVGDKISDMQAAITAGIPNNFLLASGRNLDVPTYFEGKVKIVSSLFEIIPEL